MIKNEQLEDILEELDLISAQYPELTSRMASISNILGDIKQGGKRDLYVNYTTLYPCYIVHPPKRDKGEKGDTQFNFIVKLGNLEIPVIFYSRSHSLPYIVKGAEVLIYGALALHRGHITVKAYNIIPRHIPEEKELDNATD